MGKLRAVSLCTVIFLFSTVITSYGQQGNKKGPVVFEAGKISDAFPNRDMTISPDGNELFFTEQFTKNLFNVIMHSVKKNGVWGTPEVASFSGMWDDMEASFSPDGKTLYFSSARPLTDTGEEKDFDIWYVIKENGVWQNPRNLGAPVNTTTDEFYASATKSGSIYFTRGTKDRADDIWVCKNVDGHLEGSKQLSDSVNSAGYEFNAFVDPDEQFILYTAYRRPEGQGSGDLYISRKNAAGEWGKGVNLQLVNSRSMDYCPFVTADKKYLYFTSDRASFKAPLDKPITTKALRTIMDSPGNGFDDIYVVPFSAVMP